jgi:hypothetical protein
MMKIFLAALALASVFLGSGSWAADTNASRELVKAEARRGFEGILDLWRAWDYDALYAHVVPAAGSDLWHFVDQLNHSGRRPACCWEKIQDVTVVYLDDSSVLLTAKLGIEVEGFGTRFVTRTFRLVKEAGVWRLPETDVLSLAEPNMQRIPREILERPL